jgi:hypothetical protein
MVNFSRQTEVHLGRQGRLVIPATLPKGREKESLPAFSGRMIRAVNILGKPQNYALRISTRMLEHPSNLSLGLQYIFLLYC